MEENNKGIRRLLRLPNAYSTFQNLLGAKKVREFIVNETLDLKPAIKILDLGCGPADILTLLPDSIQYTGIDYNDSYIQSAKQKFMSRGKFLCCDLNELEIQSETYDRILLIGFLHHLNDENASALISKAMTFLNPGGFLIALENVRTTPQNKIARYLIDKDRGQYVRNQEGYVKLFKNSKNLECFIRTDLFRIPYSHIFIKSFR